MSATLSVIVASSGRPSLIRTLGSFVPQLCPGDQLLVDVNDDSPWGHRARNRQMKFATGDGLLFIDDDDEYLPGALNVVRDYLTDFPGAVHIFRMQYVDGRTLWLDREVRSGNVSTQMFCVPNGHLGKWSDRYEGDFDFLTSTLELIGDPVWHSDVIALKD